MSLLTTAAQAFTINPSYIHLVHLVNLSFIIIKFIIALFGSLVILIGASIAIYRYFLYRLLQPSHYDLNEIRLDLAQSIILSLEFFVASDVIETMVAPDFYSLGILAILVIIRTILNFSMQRQITTLSNKTSKFEIA